MGPEYVNWQIISRILELLLRRFCENLNNDHTRYSRHLQVMIRQRVVPVKIYLTIYDSLKNSYF